MSFKRRFYAFFILFLHISLNWFNQYLQAGNVRNLPVFHKANNFPNRLKSSTLFLKGGFAMKITEPALAELKKILAQNNADGLEVVLQQSCCGISPAFQMVRFDENDKPDDVEGILILASGDAKKAVEDVIIDLKDGELVVYNPVCGCGDGECGHDHDHEGGCCGDHDHDHEGGCCGGCH